MQCIQYCSSVSSGQQINILVSNEICIDSTLRFFIYIYFLSSSPISIQVQCSILLHLFFLLRPLAVHQPCTSRLLNGLIATNRMLITYANWPELVKKSVRERALHSILSSFYCLILFFDGVYSGVQQNKKIWRRRRRIQTLFLRTLQSEHLRLFSRWMNENSLRVCVSGWAMAMAKARKKNRQQQNKETDTSAMCAPLQLALSSFFFSLFFSLTHWLCAFFFFVALSIRLEEWSCCKHRNGQKRSRKKIVRDHRIDNERMHIAFEVAAPTGFCIDQ